MVQTCSLLRSTNLVLLCVVFTSLSLCASERNSADEQLRIASWDGHYEGVQAALRAGADANTANKHEWTPLYGASWRGHEGVVKLLLGAGADANQANKDGETPLYGASWWGHKGVAVLLSKRGAYLLSREVLAGIPQDSLSFALECNEIITERVALIKEKFNDPTSYNLPVVLQDLIVHDFLGHKANNNKRIKTKN